MDATLTYSYDITFIFVILSAKCATYASSSSLQRFREIVAFLEGNDTANSNISCWDNVVLNANGGWQTVREYLADLNIVSDMRLPR